MRDFWVRTRMEILSSPSSRMAPLPLSDGRAYHQPERSFAEHGRAMNEAQAWTEALGPRYEQTCDEVYKTPATSLQELLAKLQCATRGIRDIVRGRGPRDIELRFVFPGRGAYGAYSPKRGAAPVGVALEIGRPLGERWFLAQEAEQIASRDL
jgi:hypothetical protein